MNFKIRTELMFRDLEHYRIDENLSMIELAERLGVSPATLYAVKNGGIPSLFLMVNITLVTNRKIDDYIELL